MTDLVEVLRDKTEGIGWIFNYGRSDFQNLTATDDENDPKWYFFLDPITTDNTDASKIINTGYFMILSKSDMDQVYDNQDEVEPNDGKFRKNILPKKQYLAKEFRNLLECGGDIEITKSIVTDVINFFDDNLDGVLVNFTITQFL